VGYLPEISEISAKTGERETEKQVPHKQRNRCHTSFDYSIGRVVLPASYSIDAETGAGAGTGATRVLHYSIGRLIVARGSGCPNRCHTSF
jgi:hypothetical protein